MSLECERCGTAVAESPGGLSALLGLGGGLGGYECRDCGVIVCGDCFRRRRRELGGASHRRCPQCGSVLEHR